MKLLCLLTAVTLLGLHAQAFGQNETGSLTNVFPNCMVHLIKDIEVPAKETGLLKELTVKENDPVSKDGKVGQIDDKIALRMKEQAQLKYSIAMRQSEDENQIKMADQKKKLTADEFDTNKRLYEKGSLPLFDAQRSLYQMKIASFEYDAAMEAKLLAGLQAQTEEVNVKAAEDSILRHQVVSPIDGLVLEKFKEAGEWVNAGESIIRVAPLDKLHVHCSVDSEFYNPEELIQKPVTVTLTRARGEQVNFEGVVVRTGLESLGGRDFKVIAEVTNQKDAAGRNYMLQPGSSVVMKIHVNRTSPTFGSQAGGQ